MIDKGISIIIPTWNSLPYLKLLINSLNINSYFRTHEIIVHINEDHSGTEDWIKFQTNIKYTISKNNIGICKAINTAYSLATRDIIMYWNDDMVALPEWDLELNNFYNSYFSNEKKIWLSSTMIEPTGFNDCCISPNNYGLDVCNFDYDKLLIDIPKLKNIKGYVNGSTWPPNLLFRSVFEQINGMCEEYIEGFGSDPDLAMRMYEVGVRDFIGVGSSLVYHFQCKSTSKIRNTGHGRNLFIKKHGMSIEHFVNNIIKRGTKWTPKIVGK